MQRIVYRSWTLSTKRQKIASHPSNTNLATLTKQPDRKNTMQQSHAYNDASLALTTEVLDAKARKNLSWQDLTDGTGLGLAYVTAALLGQHPLPESAAKVIGEKLELDADSVARLQIIPLRGSLSGVPTDPTIYRFYEMIQIYGTTLKALVHEQFGDGIISAINFKLDMKKVEDPEGGHRAVITLDGKFLPLRPF
jgi:cyanate lyase